jgi:serine/threonine-protein kinase
LLPKGIDPNSCKPIDLKGTLARVQCDGSIPTGAIAGIFALFVSQSSMDGGFDGTVAGADLMNCPNGDTSPSTWSYSRDPNTPAGRIACSTYKGEPELTWTKNRDLIMSYVQGGHDPKALYDWWFENG